MMHFGRYDEELINLKIEHNVGQLDQDHIRAFQERIRSPWASNLPPEVFTMLLNEGFKNFGNKTAVKGNDMELFHFLSAGPFVINHAPAKLQQNLQKIEDLIKNNHFIPFPPRPKRKIADFEDENAKQANSYSVQEEYPPKDGFENIRQLNVIARAILIHLPLVQLWKEEGYTEICRDVNELVMQGALLILFPPSPTSEWKSPSVQKVVGRLEELKMIGFQLTDAVIGDALFLFENRLNDFGDVFMEAFQKVRGEPKNILASRCFYEVTKPERNLKSKFLLEFLHQHINPDEQKQSVEHAMIYHRLGPNRIEDKGKKNVITPPTKKIKRLRLSHIVYEWVLEKLGPCAKATSLCFYDILRARIALGQSQTSPNQQNRPNQQNQSGSTSKSDSELIRDLYEMYRKEMVPYENIHVCLLTTTSDKDHDALRPFFDGYLPRIFELKYVDLNPTQYSQGTNDSTSSRNREFNNAPVTPGYQNLQRKRRNFLPASNREVEDQKKKWKGILLKFRAGHGILIDYQDRDYQGQPTTYQMNPSRLFLDKVDMFLDRLRFPNEQRFNRENEEVGGDNNRHIQKRPKTQT